MIEMHDEARTRTAAAGRVLATQLPGKALVALLTLAFALTLSSPALAGPPTHSRKEALDIAGLNHACGVAVDSQGDVYAASAGEAEVKVFNPSHTLIASISNSNEPCGLAVDSKGDLYVSEKASGDVVKYVPNAYPLTGAPTYGAAIPVDSSGNAKGIAVDPHDDRLYVAEGDHVASYQPDGSFEANLGEGELSEATGVAVYSYVSYVAKIAEGKIFNEEGTRHLFVADPAAGATDTVKALSGTFKRDGGGPLEFGSLKLRRTIAGVDQDRNPETPDQSFGFGASGAYLAVDSGNSFPEPIGVPAKQKCSPVAEQACTVGHLLLYDQSHEVVDELDASGEFLDRLPVTVPDGGPTAMAVDRSGGPNDGTIYISTGAAAGAKALAFGPLASPSRAQLGEPLSHVLANAQAVTTDSRGDVYVAADAAIKVYGTDGAPLATFNDSHTPLQDLAVDSEGHLYVLESENQVTYYTPSAFPPVSGTTYARHETPVANFSEFDGIKKLNAIAVNPGPSAGKDHLFVASTLGPSIGQFVHEYDSAASGSTLLDSEFAEGPRASGLCPGGVKVSIGVDGATGAVYFGEFSSQICIVDASGEEVLARISGGGGPQGNLPINPNIAVDQSNGHVIAFDPSGTAEEYDAAGSFVAEFGQFTPLARQTRVAIDNSCALHDPPLTEATTPTCAEFDPSYGTAYVAYDDTKLGTPDVWAFDRLEYGEAPGVATGVAGEVGAGNARLNGSVDPNGFELSSCEFKYLSESQYLSNGETFAGASLAPCVPGLAEIGKGSAPVAVHADIAGLDPDGRYRFVLVAANKYGESSGEAGLFGAPLITAKPALPVLYREATLRAEVDPSGLETTYRFQYGEGAVGEYGHTTPLGTLPAGAGPSAVQATLTGLVEGREYHFRVVAESEAGPVFGPDQTFTTLARRSAEGCANVEYRTGLSAKLPDCRAYELVTPAETNGLTPAAAIVGPGAAGAGFATWLVIPRGPEAGDVISYFTEGTLPGFDGNGRLDGYHARRGLGEHPPEGWSSAFFGLDSAQQGGFESLSRGVSADQRYAFWFSEPLMSFEGTLPKGAYVRIPDGATNPACNPVPSQSDFELVGCGSQDTDPEAKSQFLSPGGDHVIFSSAAQLEEGGPGGGTTAIYDRRAREAKADIVSVKPGGEPFATGEDASFLGSSEDGEAVVFRVAGAMYVHRGGETYEVATAPNTFAGVSSDGERVFWSAAESLFACDVAAGPCAGEGSHPPTQIAAAGSFINVSEDGSHVFFSSEEALGSEENEAGESSEAGKPNLYAWDGAATSFVAVLDESDFKEGAFGGIGHMNLAAWNSAINTDTRGLSPTRSTPDGDVFVFQSHAQLTGYDNEGFGEIYRYAPGAPPGQRLTCPSCDPTNAPPSADALLQDLHNTSGTTAETLISNLTDDGSRLIFQSQDRLSPEDANDALDVYEWSAKGSSGCSRPGGCLDLISSGQGEGPSYLYGMSADGRDVFFRTDEKLLGADVRGSPSLYDAREGGGIPEAQAPTPCQGDSCQGQGSPPPALPGPGSATSGEAGALPPTRRCGKAKHLVKGRCIKAHKKHRAHKRGRHARKEAAR